MYRCAAADVGGLRMLLCLAGMGGCMSLLPVHQSEFVRSFNVIQQRNNFNGIKLGWSYYFFEKKYYQAHTLEMFRLPTFFE